MGRVNPLEKIKLNQASWLLVGHRDLHSFLKMKQKTLAMIEWACDLALKIRLGIAIWLLVVSSAVAFGGNITRTFRIDGPLVVSITPEGAAPGVKQTQRLETKEDLRKALEKEGLPMDNIIQLEYSPDRKLLIVRGPKELLDLVEVYLETTSAYLPLQMEEARIFLKATGNLDSINRAHVIADDHWYPWMAFSYYATELLKEPKPSSARIKQFDASYLRWKQYLESELRAYEADLKR